MNYDIPLSEAKAWLRERVQKGAQCPCCNQYAKVYKRKITSSMARGLILMYRHCPVEYIHVNDLNARWRSKDGFFGGGEFAKLSHWGLIEQMEKDPFDDSKKTSGTWRMTQNGRDFVDEKLLVPRHIFIYNNTVINSSKESQSIREALRDKFNYKELMES
jgi:hypothetical protein